MTAPAKFCALCTSNVGPFVVRPLGRNSAPVHVCERCDTEHPRSGGYSFGEARQWQRAVKGNKKSGAR